MIGGASDRYRVLIARAEAIAAGNAEDMPRIPAICRQLSVSQRTLRKAFRSVYGQSPCRRIRVLRLNQARQALLAVDCETAKVTEIAICFGFFELGRFSVEYRKLFGESPSQTLRAAGRDREMSHDGRAGLRNARIDYQNSLSRAFGASVMGAVQDRDVEAHSESGLAEMRRVHGENQSEGRRVD